MAKSHKKALLDLFKKDTIVRASHVTARGIPREYLSRFVEDGTIVRESRGRYRLPSTPTRDTLADLASRCPHGVIALLSALRFHEIGTQNPSEVWMAISLAARKPVIDYPPVRFLRFSSETLTAGIRKYKIDGVEVPIYTIEKTIADCFKYRNKLGIDVAIEALKDALSKKKVNLNALWNFAELCRVTKIIRPYVEALI